LVKKHPIQSEKPRNEFCIRISGGEYKNNKEKQRNLEVKAEIEQNY
jgi:hypothetical protein